MKDHFQLEHQDTISRESIPSSRWSDGDDARLRQSFRTEVDLGAHGDDDQDVVVISVRIMGVGGPEFLSADQQSFSEHEQMVFTKPSQSQKSFCKKVSLLVVPAAMCLQRWLKVRTRSK